MATKELKARYGEGKTRTIINRAIRAEIPGGEEIIELRKWWHLNDDSAFRAHTLRVLDAVLRLYEVEIRKRYEMNLTE